MRRYFSILLILSCLSPFSVAVDGKSLLIGISIGLGIYTYKGTREKVILPVTHKIQKAIRPLPQDKIEKEQKRAAKRAAKLRIQIVR